MSEPALSGRRSFILGSHRLARLSVTLAAVVATLAVAALAVWVPLGHAATTPTVAASYGYDSPATFVQPECQRCEATSGRVSILPADSCSGPSSCDLTKSRLFAAEEVSLPEALTVGRNAEEGVHVYNGVRDGENVYTGITNNLARRQAQHGDRFVLEPMTDTGVTRGEARAIEQAQIARNPGLENVRNSISPTHDYYDQAVAWGNQWLQAHGF